MRNIGAIAWRLVLARDVLLCIASYVALTRLRLCRLGEIFFVVHLLRHGCLQKVRFPFQGYFRLFKKRTN